MAVPKSRRLDPLLQRAADREAAVAREFAAKSRLVANNEQKLADLQRYSEEYGQAPVGVTSPAMLANRESFRGKLKDAVVLQSQAVEHSRANAELERLRLVMAARDTKVLQKLTANYRAEEARGEAKREQKALDDHAGRNHLRNRREENTP